MVNILALEASSDACSVAVLQGNKVVQDFRIVPRQHNQLLLPMVEAILSECNIDLNDLDAIAYSRGPGAFTGIRIAAGVAQGLAFGADLPLLAISTLEAMGLAALDDDANAKQVIVCQDARMQEVYIAAFERNGDQAQSLMDEQVMQPEALKFAAITQAIGVGSGWEFIDQMPESEQQKITSHKMAHPQAEYIARIAKHQFEQGIHTTPEQAQPVYVRDQVTWKKVSEQGKSAK
jgi:tRNA threonylcarbamoyladenosine biosynthesis protein TsaB